MDSFTGGFVCGVLTIGACLWVRKVWNETVFDIERILIEQELAQK